MEYLKSFLCYNFSGFHVTNMKNISLILFLNTYRLNQSSFTRGVITKDKSSISRSLECKPIPGYPLCNLLNICFWLCQIQDKWDFDGGIFRETFGYGIFICYYVVDIFSYVSLKTTK